MSCNWYTGRRIHVAEWEGVRKKLCKRLPLAKLREKREKSPENMNQIGKLHSPRAGNEQWQKNKMIKMHINRATKFRDYSRSEAISNIRTEMF